MRPECCPWTGRPRTGRAWVAYPGVVTEWVVLLRGVNVGGITVRSTDLRETLEALGLGEVRTVLASGNATFTARGGVGERSRLKARLAGALRDRFHYAAWLLRSETRRGGKERGRTC